MKKMFLAGALALAFVVPLALSALAVPPLNRPIIEDEVKVVGFFGDVGRAVGGAVGGLLGGTIGKVVPQAKCAVCVGNPLYFQTLAGAKLVKSQGLIKNKDQCMDTGKMASALALVELGVVASFATEVCGSCICDIVF